MRDCYDLEQTLEEPITTSWNSSSPYQSLYNEPDNEPYQARSIVKKIQALEELYDLMPRSITLNEFHEWTSCMHPFGQSENLPSFVPTPGPQINQPLSHK
jgi:hypothetical protein